MTPDALAAVMDATWPPARSWRAGPWRIRDGQGGGQRVSATTAEGDWTPADLALAEAEALALGQRPLFMVGAQDARLDQVLEAAGYRRHDPVVAYAAPLTALAGPVDLMAAFPHWPPLAIACDLWAQGGIGPARLAVMDRVQAPKCAVLGRSHDHPSGVCFVAIHQGTAMLHALEVAPNQRRQGSAHNMLRSAANWALDKGAERLALVVTEANAPARGLYASLGMQVVGQYHYRVK